MPRTDSCRLAAPAPCPCGSRAALALALLAAALLDAAPAGAQQREGLSALTARPGLENIELLYRSVRIEGDLIFLSGDVDLLDPDHDVRLLADELQFNVVELTFEAEGNVSFEQGELLLNGRAMRGDLDAGTIEMEDVVGVAPGPVYVRGERILQLEPGKFRLEHGVVTPCNQTSPAWEFRSSSMTFKPGSYVKMAWPHVRVKGLPLIGLPYVFWPLQEKARQTGLLLPGIGSSNRKGFMFSQPFFWAIGRSADLTLTYERFSRAGSGYGGEFRYALSEDTGGFLRGYYLPGRQVTAEQAAAGAISFPSGFSVRGAHLQGLPGGLTLRAQADFVSSTDFIRNFRDDVNGFLQRQSVLSADLSKSWGPSTLTFVADHRENFNSTTLSTTGRRLPQIKYTLRSTQLAGPLYVALQSSVARFEKRQKRLRKKKPALVSGGAYTRLDAFPEMSLQVTQIPWLTFKPFFRWRTTYWNRSESASFEFEDDSITRHFYETGIEMVGPSVFKIFDTPGSDYSPRIKHLIQPRLVYSRANSIDTRHAGRIIQFDEVDSAVADREDLRLEVTTRLFAKRYLNPSDDQRQIWQIGEFTVGRLWNLRPLSEALESAGAPRVRLPYFATLILQPTARLYFRTDARFTPDLRPANVSLNARLNGAGGSVGLTWFRGVRDFLDPLDLRRVLLQTTSNSLRTDATVNLFARRLTLGSGADVDLRDGRLQNLNGSLTWNHQCCSIGLDIRRLNFADRQETQFSFLLNLAQVGSLGFDSQRR